MDNDQNALMKYLLQFCYTCERAGKCLDEETVIDCMTDHEVTLENQMDDANETQKLLRLYAF